MDSQKEIALPKWHVESDTEIRDHNGDFVGSAHDPESSFVTEREYGNARLMAAAPDLLRALKRARQRILEYRLSEAAHIGAFYPDVAPKIFPNGDPYFTEIDAAIAQAEPEKEGKPSGCDSL